MNGLAWSIVLAAVGISGLWLAGRKDWRGWAVGLAAQILWIIYALATAQYGFILSALAYGWVFYRNLRLWLRTPDPASGTPTHPHSPHLAQVYVCGPMTGKPNLNREAFDRAAAIIRARGDVPVLPHDLPVWEHEGECVEVYGHKSGYPHDGGCYVRNDIAVMVLCDSIYRLKGWETSTGAQIESEIIRMLMIPMEDES